jgi:hypothetical protein
MRGSARRRRSTRDSGHRAAICTETHEQIRPTTRAGTLSVDRPLPAGIHVVLGDAAAAVFRRAFKPDESPLVDQDVLSCGPTPATQDLVAWQNIRERYWRNLVPQAELEHVPSPFNLVDNAQRLAEDAPIYLWAGTSLSEQLFIAFAIHLMDVVGADAKRVSLVQFEQLPGSQSRVMGIGELKDEQMAAYPEPAALTDETLADYRAAWAALTATDPANLQSFTIDRPNANRWLAQAMPLMLRRFPDKATGLPFWDRVLLEKVREHAPKTAKVIAAALVHDLNDPDLTGDWYLFGRLLRMGDERLPRPLLSLVGDEPRMDTLRVWLTPFGEAVLEGRDASYPANPIEDHAAGVRLSSTENRLWFMAGDRLEPG